MSRPGTYRESDNSGVPFSEALTEWGRTAHDELLRTASRYNSVITYKELAELAQARSGIRTRVLLTNWIGKLLEQVARRAVDAGQPPLTSLCVHQDGTIGDGYAKAAVMFGAGDIKDVELRAADDRLQCYRAYAEDLPSDGGRARLTRQVAERRARADSTTQRREPKSCPACHIALPASGICGYCA